MDQRPKTPVAGSRATPPSADDPHNWLDVEQKMEMKLTQLNRLMHHFASHQSSNLYPDLPYQNILVKNDGEVEQMLRETAAKIKNFKEATIAKRVETSNKEAMEALVRQHEAVQRACLNEFQSFRLKADERERALLSSANEREKQFGVFRKKFENDMEEKDQKSADWVRDKEAQLVKEFNEREKKIQADADKQIESLRREMDSVRLLLAEKTEQLKQATNLAEQYLKDLGESKRQKKRETEQETKHRVRCEPVETKARRVASPDSKQRPQQEQEPKRPITPKVPSPDSKQRPQQEQEPKRPITPKIPRASTPQRAVTPKPPFVMRALQSTFKDDRLLETKAYQDSKLRINDEIKRMKWLMRDRDSVHSRHSSLELRGY